MRILSWIGFSLAAAAAVAAKWLPAHMLLPAALSTLLLSAAIFLFSLRPFCRFGPALKRTGFALAGAAVGFGLCWLYASTIQAAALSRVSDVSQSCEFTVTDYCTETDYGCRTYGKLRCGNRNIKTVIYLNNTNEEIRPGSILNGNFVLASASDSSSYWASVGVCLSASQRGSVSVDTSECGGLTWFPKRLGHRFAGILDTIMDQTHAGFFKALLLGDRSDLAEELQYDLQLSGIFHALAVSGLHVNILVGVLSLLIGKRKRALALTAIPLCWCFAVMTGSSPSICRAATMQTVVLLAPVFGREYDGLTALAAALILLLLPNPNAILSTGLLLSFSSVAGILLFSEKLNTLFLSSSRLAAAEKKNAGRGALIRAAAASASVSLSSMVFTVPVGALSFQTFSVVAPITNFFGLWAVTFSFCSGFLLCLLGLLSVPAAGALAWLPALGADYLSGLSGFLGRLPCACLFMDSDFAILFTIFLYLIVGVCFLFRYKKPTPPILCIVVVFCLSMALPAAESRSAEYMFRVLDVGQGQCILLTSGSSSAMIDCGGSDAVWAGEYAARCCMTAGEYTLDLLILTHYDSDHAGGISRLLDRVRVRQLILPDVAPESELRLSVEALAEEKGIPVLYVSDQALEASFGAGTLRIFAPIGDPSGSNVCSAVEAIFDNDAFLITGDLNIEAEETLISQNSIPKLHALVAGHHGSAESTSAVLLEELCPDIVLISVGKNNYGHPTQEVLKRIDAIGAELYRTDQNGTLVLRKGG